jgi:hypothetical protein
VTPPGSDGAWSVKPASVARYKTRFLVRRPTDAARFNGTVLVEWLNVSGGVDADHDFAFAHVELLRDGFAYVGVSAQAEGVIGGGFSLVQGQQPLVKWDPQRYGSLQHPGNAYSYDIFSQATRAVRNAGAGAAGPHPLGSLQPVRWLATGESQSAFRMVTYADAIQPTAKLFDGIFIHSRAAGAAPLTVSTNTGATAGFTAGPSLALIRGDLGIPVFQFLTETDVLGLSIGLTAFSGARQPDTDHLRTWEVAGTSHADAYLLSASTGADTDAGLDAGAGALGCSTVNSGPQHWVLDTAFAAMQAWLKTGTAPAHGDPLVLGDGGAGFAKDGVGNTLGGVRTAAVDVPIAVYSGQSSSSSLVCSLFGSTTPLPADQLLSLYPTHADYVTKVTAATTTAQQAGFILPADAPLVVAEAQAAPVPQ